MIHVIATVELNPGTREKFLAEFRKLIPDVKAEVGCIEYGPAIDAETDIPIQFKIGPDKVTIIEKWEDTAALKAHGVAPHMQAYRARVKGFVRGMELRVLAPA
jgi:quinol monooxygenase YgiN